MSETEISKSIRDTLRKADWRVERINSGKVKVSGGWMHLASPGTPDLLCMKAIGLFGFLETKTAIGKLSDKQVEWHAWARTAGINVAMVRSAIEALDVVKEWEKN